MGKYSCKITLNIEKEYDFKSIEAPDKNKAIEIAIDKLPNNSKIRNDISNEVLKF